ncbi:hypothetical protein BDW66DRAFT_119899 [Aspergillus desertorum]
MCSRMIASHCRSTFLVTKEALQRTFISRTTVPPCKHDYHYQPDTGLRAVTSASPLGSHPRTKLAISKYTEYLHNAHPKIHHARRQSRTIIPDMGMSTSYFAFIMLDIPCLRVGRILAC